MLENDGTKLVRHILPYTPSLHYHDAQFPTAVRRLFLIRFATLRSGFYRCVSSAEGVGTRVLHNRGAKNQAIAYTNVVDNS